ncbi:MAG: DUF502 domain-containing protein [Deltaproteobacteria bacterium]|nr:DUF502 domain-containing protein [Deltaproteobacteria bacterium]MBI2532705.1 DUF502 domain-containing protein [Deltaproteobacteria bacterium]
MAAGEQPIKTRVRVRESLQRYFLAGLLVFLPVAITLWFLGWVVELLDSVLDVLPKAFHPNSYLPIPVPRLGAVVTLVMILFLGFLTRGVATRRFLAVWEGVFAKIPVFRGIYTAVQKMVQTFLGPSNAQRQVVMIEYPRAGVFTVAFAMGRAWADLENKTNVQLVNVFVPTTPNPTSGFYLLVPSHEVTPLNMTIEEAFKLITSGGLITPDDKNKNGK